ncbi:MAG: protein kinase [Nitrospinae bacterium]|nr:protein kinase [Nitrospinota bacterium]MBF0633667.1 protein kinase [Nitrospinota bacterium]
MTLIAECSECGAKYVNVRPEQAGKTAKCKKCGARFTVKPHEPAEGEARPASAKSIVMDTSQPSQPFSTVAFGEDEEPTPPPPPPAPTVVFDVKEASAPSATVAFGENESQPQPSATVAFNGDESPSQPSATVVYEEHVHASPATTVPIPESPPAEPMSTVLVEHSGPAETVFAQGEESARPAESEEEAAVPLDWADGDVILGIYEVRGLLGEGGMGKVYKAHHLGWDVDIAVKSPRPQEIRKPGAAENFEREAETWVNLGLHPNIVSCYYVRRLGGLPRVFAEFIDGGSLQDWIKQGRISTVGEALDVAIQFAWGLHYSHERGLTHQDIKPANVMMTAGGVAKVTDFGLARARIGGMTDQGAGPASVKDALVTAGGMTPAYCSPEQAERAHLSPKTDIWSWAVSILEMFTGEVTWMSGAVADSALDEFMLSGAKGKSPVAMPASLAELLKWCLNRDPSQRPSSMMDVANVLREMYRKETGIPYPRMEIKPGKAVADNLNNRAVSLLDLGKGKEAERLWEEALKVQPHHPESTFNLGLSLWRSGRIADMTAMRRVEEAMKSHVENWNLPYYLALINMERDDYGSAVSTLASVGDEEAKGAIEPMAKTAQERLDKSRRLLKSVQAHAKSATATDISADGKFILTGGDDRAVKLWDAKSGELIRTFSDAHKSPVTRVCLSADGSKALTCGYRAAIMWDTAKGEPIRTFASAHEGWISSAWISGAGDRVLTAGWDGVAKTWEPQIGAPLGKLADCYGSAWLSSDGRSVVSGHLDNTVKMWKADGGAILQTIKTHPGPMAMSSDDQYLITSDMDNTLKLWEVTTGRLKKVMVGHTESVTSVTFTGDGMLVLSSSYDGTVRLWDSRTGRLLRTFEGHAGPVYCVRCDASGSLAVSSGWDGTVRTWSLGASMPYRAPMAICRIQASETVLSAGVDYENRVIEAREALSRGDMKTVIGKIRDARSQKGYSRGSEAVELWGSLYTRLPRKGLKGGWEGVVMMGHEDSVTSVSITQDGGRILSGGLDRTLRLWSAASGSAIKTLKGHTDRVNTVDMSGDGGLAVSGSGDWTVRLWDLEAGECLAAMEGHSGPVNSVALTGDGAFAVSGGGDGMVILWGVSSGRRARRFAGHAGAVNAVAVTRDCRMIISGGDDKDLRLWETVTGDQICVMSGHQRPVHCVSFNHDGSQAISGSADGEIRLWDTATAACLKTISDGEDPVNSISFTLDGAYAFSGHASGSARLWDLKSGSLVRIFTGHSASVNSVCISWDSGIAISCGADKTVKTWQLDWELDDSEKPAWDDKAVPYIMEFLMEATPYVSQLPHGRDPFENEVKGALQRAGSPGWSKAEQERLVFTLGCAGLGWLNPEELSKRLFAMGREFKPPAAVDKTTYTRTRKVVAGIFDAEMEAKASVIVTNGEAPVKPVKRSLIGRLFGR